MNVYLAGKIRPGDWREELVPGLRDAYQEQFANPCCHLSEQMLGRPHYAVDAASAGVVVEVVRESTMRWPVVEIPHCPGWSYVGPYFVGAVSKHYIGWDARWHGWGTYDTDRRFAWECEVRNQARDELMSDDDVDEILTPDPCRREASRAMVHALNSRAIQDCDALVAFIDADDCYGTLAEIGYAARDKLIGIVTNDLAHFQEEHWFALQYAHTVVHAEEPVEGVLEALSRLEDEARRRSIARLRAMPYREYLETEWWQTVRSGALDRAGHRCQLCGANGTTELHVHHNSYENRGAEHPEDLVVLCRACHSKHHDKTR